MNKLLTPRNRTILYSAWLVVSTILTAYGVALPGGQEAWDQFIFAVLGAGSLGFSAMAIRHTQPAAGLEDTMIDAPGGDDAAVRLGQPAKQQDQ